MDWPTFYPEDCPPEDAVLANGTVYRLVGNNIINEYDFWSQRELRPDATFRDVTECQACGVSVFTDLAEIEAVNRNPYMRRKKKKIAVGHLDASMGEMKHTPSRQNRSHHTWWIPANIDPTANFEAI